MKFVVTNAQMKSAERLCDERHISYSQMMKNAGNAAGERVLALCPEKATAAVLCGSGNNGGDGFVIARKLLENGVDTRVILANGAPKTEISREYFSLLPRDIVFDYSTDKTRCNAVLGGADITDNGRCGSFYALERSLK
ncbi:MAG: NAD(P)H-hydrate epimerase [Oscillospiraceae bacterium]